ncbi:MAG: hypothetical protein ACQCN6_13190 [Candidatus Bathyarchaeia archaeon]
MARLRAKKNAFFWLGLLMIVLASLFVIPVGYRILSDYLFPYDNRGAIAVNPVTFVFDSLIIIGVGIIFLAVGTINIRLPKWTPPKEKS